MFKLRSDVEGRILSYLKKNKMHTLSKYNLIIKIFKNSGPHILLTLLHPPFRFFSIQALYVGYAFKSKKTNNKIVKYLSIVVNYKQIILHNLILKV